MATTQSASSYPITLELVADVGGASQTVAVSGSYAYLHEGVRLDIFDASDPANPQYMSNIRIGRPITKIFPDGNLLYVCTSDSGLYVVDVSNPMSPSIISHPFLIGTRVALGDIEVVNQVAYIADFYQGLRIVDVQDPNNPVELVRFDTTALTLDVVGNRAYVIDGTRMRVVDISVPGSPSQVGVYHNFTYPMDVKVNGNYAYVLCTGMQDTLHVLDISNPGSITPVSAHIFGSPSDVWKIDISGNRAYIANGLYGLYIIDISDPFTPSYWGDFNTDFQAMDLSVTGNYIYLAMMNSNLLVIDASNPAALTQAGVYIGPVPLAVDVLVKENFAYVAAAEHGMRLLDVTDPAQPANFSYYYHPGIRAVDLEKSGNYIFLADSKTGLYTIDVSNTSSPQQVGFLNISAGVTDICMKKNYIYALDMNSMFYTINVSDPTHPAISGNTQLTSSLWKLDVLGDYAYAIGTHLRVLDISNKVNPMEVGSIVYPLTYGMDIGTREPYAFIAEINRLSVWDLTDPITPVLAGEDTTMAAAHMFIHGDYAYLSNYRGIQVIDISNPAQPVRASAYYEAFWSPYASYVDGEYVYVADYWQGLSIYRTNQPPPHFSTALVVTNTNDSGTGSLRDALQQGNSNPGPDSIHFQIPLSDPNYLSDDGAWRIRPQTQLPVISDGGLVIDGTTQADFLGYDVNPDGPEIEIDGSDLSNYESGLTVQAEGCQINYLVVNNFPLGGIYMQETEGVRITGCYLGTDVTGRKPAPNEYGIHIVDHCRYVGIEPADTMSPGNVISGNSASGIFVADTCRHLAIIGNVIGLSSTREDTLGNGVSGIGIQGKCDSISIAENYIGANTDGIYISESEAIWIFGNRIGTEPSWNRDFGNHYDGIYLSNGTHHTYISENIIGRNWRNGVTVSGSTTTSNMISTNGISGNFNLGISNRSGGNLELVPPQILSVTSSEANGIAGPNQTVEVYSDTGSQGRHFLGTGISDGSGNFTVTLSESPPFTNVTATARDASGNTSEFSAPYSEVGVLTSTDRPASFFLTQNHPNPFNPETTIQFGVKERCRVVLKLYNILGHEIMTLTDKTYTAGTYELQFEAGAFSSGLYLYAIEMKDFRTVRKMMVLK